jgi:HSP20 family protein
MNLLKRWKPEERWHPFRELEELQHRMDAPFRLRVREVNQDDLDVTVSQWSPLVDIVEDEKEYLIKAEIPDLNREDIRVSVDDGVLTIRGERKFGHEEKNKKYHRVEWAYGHFTRNFVLPEDSDAAKVAAEFKHGLLNVHLPKTPEAASKSIEVKVG